MLFRSSNSWCPYCCIPSKKLCNDEECSHCFNKSFASYDGKTIEGKLKVDCWIQTKNDGLTPRNITKSSGRKFWFKCDECSHKFHLSLQNIMDKKKSWCAYCANKKLCNDTKCKKCLNNSFASYKGETKNGKLKTECWLVKENNNLTPRDEIGRAHV